MVCTIPVLLSFFLVPKLSFLFHVFPPYNAVLPLVHVVDVTISLSSLQSFSSVGCLVFPYICYSLRLAFPFSTTFLFLFEFSPPPALVFVIGFSFPFFPLSMLFPLRTPPHFFLPQARPCPGNPLFCFFLQPSTPPPSFSQLSPCVFCCFGL